MSAGCMGSLAPSKRILNYYLLINKVLHITFLTGKMEKIMYGDDEGAELHPLPEGKTTKEWEKVSWLNNWFLICLHCWNALMSTIIEDHYCDCLLFHLFALVQIEWKNKLIIYVALEFGQINSATILTVATK